MRNHILAQVNYRSLPDGRRRQLGFVSGRPTLDDSAPIAGRRNALSDMREQMMNHGDRYVKLY